MQIFPTRMCNVTAWRHSRLRPHWLMALVAGGWGGPRELQRLLSLIGYCSSGGVCRRSLTVGKILFSGRQTCSLYLVLWLCGWGGIPREFQRPLSLFVYGSTGGVCGRSLKAGKILFTGRQTCSLYSVLWLFCFWRVNKKIFWNCFFFFFTQAFAYLHDMRRQGEIYSFTKD